ncbi:GNAT family N-acetyltransferase [Clostridium sp. PL3]|uniref:GNAT family N-acetyltransferase n=1 Tax=Clostridium thailandense TaxID=2794346 RepID=A0A949TRP4_9CLOT|nr:GNAT family N-acetyltransferase [Clostridium thailandense]MBV7272081.1 GNAT family N-acetyltransferase [Clostridium thailandense]
MNIREISFLTYILKCKTFSTPLSDYCIKNTVNGNGMSLLAAYADDENSSILGFCVLNKMNFKNISLDYLLVREENRRTGIGKKLLAAAINYAKEQGNVAVLARIIINTKEEDLSFIIRNKLLTNYGFQITRTSSIIRCNLEKSKPIWYNFMKEKGEKLIARSKAKGFSVVSFAKAGGLIDNLKKKIKDEFPRELNPTHFIDNPVDKLIPELSFIAVKNNIPVSYCIVTTVDGKALVFQQLSVALKYKRTGVFFLPFAAFMEQLFLQNSYHKVSYTVLDTNKEMIKLVNGFLDSFIESKKSQNFYMLLI